MMKSLTAITSTAKVLVSCSDMYFETDFQAFELFSIGSKAFESAGEKLSKKLYRGQKLQHSNLVW